MLNFTPRYELCHIRGAPELETLGTEVLAAINIMAKFSLILWSIKKSIANFRGFGAKKVIFARVFKILDLRRYLMDFEKIGS